jgi:3-oxoacyl-[acyl-carrier-protein] synthase-3
MNMINKTLNPIGPVAHYSQFPISIVDAEELLPETIIENDFFGSGLKEATNKMFLGTHQRRHFAPGDLASHYIAEATKKLCERLNINPHDDIDMIITNVSIPDEIFTGCGAVVNQLIGGKAKWIVDMHNTGCISMIYMIECARAYMYVHNLKSAIVCNVQSAAGRIFGALDNRDTPQSAIPGDGTSVVYLRADESRPVIFTIQDNYPEFSQDMSASMGDKHYWEARNVTGNIDFNESRTTRIMMRGNRLVPQMVRQGLSEMNLKPKDISYLITNQPSGFFLRNWREALELKPEQHLHTFETHANLFGAAMGINLAINMKKNLFKPGELICFAGFSHAGDYAAASFMKF